MIGDMAVKDLTPKTTNLGERLVKNLRICGSGIYTYAMSEAPLLHLDPIPDKYKNLDCINVFRPADVLVANKDKFARVPIITGHHVLVNRENAKQLCVGMVGDAVVAEEDKDDGETYLYTTGTIVAGDGVDAYEEYGQLSVGYDPVIEWGEGEHNGIKYQAILKGFNDVNHLLICRVARGGPQCMVMDSIDDRSPLQAWLMNKEQHGGMYMGIFKKIFKSAQPKVVGDAATISALLQSIALGAEPKATVQKIRDIAGDCGEELNGYLDELAAITGDEKKEDIAKAVNIVDQAFAAVSGDEHPENCSCEECKAKSEKKEEAGDADDKSAAEKPEKPEDKPEKVGGDSIDYEKLADMVAARLKPAATTAGDEQAIDEAKAAEAMKTLSTPLTGDSSSNKNSDELCKEIWG